MNRRTFLTSTGCLGASLAFGAEQPGTSNSKPAAPGRKPPVKLGLCTYSYWHFRDPKVSIETVIDKAAELGVAEDVGGEDEEVAEDVWTVDAPGAGSGRRDAL